MSQEPLVSIILPIYNAAPFLKEALDSVLKQSYTHFEVIAINDGSTDNPELIIHTYHDPRLKYVTNETNKGVAKTLNQAIHLSTGEFIMRMDADDIIEQDKIFKQIHFFKLNPNIDILGTSFSQFSYDKPLYTDLPLEDALIKLHLFFRCCLCHPTVMMRKKTLIDFNLAYNESLITAEDYALWMEAFKKGMRFANLPEKLLCYRQHPNQNTDRHIHELLILDDTIRLDIAHHFFSEIIIEYGESNYLSFINRYCVELPQLKRIKTMVNEIKKTSISNIDLPISNQYWDHEWAQYWINCCYQFKFSSIKSTAAFLWFCLKEPGFYHFKGWRKKLRFLLVCFKIIR
jgi:glycosyltransferase involved in cell wall biosynthesis